MSDFFLISCSGEYFVSGDDDEEDNVWMGLFPKSVFKGDISDSESSDNQIDISYEVDLSKGQIIFKSDKFSTPNLTTNLKSSEPDDGIISLTIDGGGGEKNIYILGEFDDCEIETLA